MRLRHVLQVDFLTRFPSAGSVLLGKYLVFRLLVPFALEFGLGIIFDYFDILWCFLACGTAAKMRFGGEDNS